MTKTDSGYNKMESSSKVAGIIMWVVISLLMLSRALVEYSDPSNIYPLIAYEFRRRLPLRNLHWVSPNRPLRSIQSLHIDLVADKRITHHTAQTEALSVIQKHESSTRKEQKKERRHQIPGLRRTPYLKIYLLQCVDVETYRVNAKKQLREWVREHTSLSQNGASLNKQENHDAFEWMIVHVIPSSGDVPSTSQLSGGARNESFGEKRPGSSRWPSLGSNSSSVIEKIRADFNGTAQNALDRVVEIQAFERPANGSDEHDQTSQDDTKGWDDLIRNMKNLILASFDLRVRQYEEDIKEKEVQRSLPGWNFHTFFILKEGLARGFESVGLVEDALIGYDELAVGLNSVIDEQREGISVGQQTASFNNHTIELAEQFKQSVEDTMRSFETPGRPQASTSDGTQYIGSKSFVQEASILDTDRKLFRELIVANDVSAFDFQCYVFARQVSLLLRLANTGTGTPKIASSRSFDDESNHDDVDTTGTRLSDSFQHSEDFSILADVCLRATDFITSAARIMRDDILAWLNGPWQEQDWNIDCSEDIKRNILENIIASWTFSASQTILEVTSVRSLSVVLQPLLKQLRTYNEASPENAKTQATEVAGIRRQDLPDRSSSLPSPISASSVFSIRESYSSAALLGTIRLVPPSIIDPSVQALAAQRGDLISLSRGALGSIGLRHGNWPVSLSTVAPIAGMDDGYIKEVTLKPDVGGDLEDDEKRSINFQDPTKAGLCNQALLSSLQSRKTFYAMFEVYGRVFELLKSTLTSNLGLYCFGARFVYC